MEDEIKFEDCPICLDVLKDQIFITPCLHKFHDSCFNEFLQKSRDKRCPICRHNIENNNDIGEEEEEEFENFFNTRRQEEHRRRMYNEIRNFQRRNEGRGLIDSFLNVMSDSNTISKITRSLRISRQIEPSTEYFLNNIGPSAMRLFGGFLRG
jgi:hypothetical protein